LQPKTLQYTFDSDISVFADEKTFVVIVLEKFEHISFPGLRKNYSEPYRLTTWSLLHIIHSVMASLKGSTIPLQRCYPCSSIPITQIGMTLLIMLCLLTNISKQESTGVTQFFMLYGREALLPIDVALGNNPNHSVLNNSFPLLQRFPYLCEQIKRKLLMVQQRQKQRYDSRRKKKFL
jgi:hypothetical protein